MALPATIRGEDDGGVRKGWDAMEWGLLALMVAAGGLLVWNEWRELGEMERAARIEREREMEELMKRRVGELELVIKDMRKALPPDAREIEKEGVDGAYTRRVREWSGPKGLFKELCVAAMDEGELNLYDVQTGGGLREWPKEWLPLRLALERKGRGKGPPPGRGERPTGLFEIPVFAGTAEREWVVMEFDGDALHRWFGEDKRVYLEREGTVYLEKLKGKPNLGVELMGWVAKMNDDGGLAVTAVEQARRNVWLSLGLTSLLVVLGTVLLTMMRRARQLAAMQMQFVAGVSHELRTPLTVIAGAGHNLQSGVVREPAQVERYGREIVEQARTLTQLVEQVMAFAGGGRPNGVVERMLVEEWIERAMEWAGPDIERGECELELSVDPGLPLVEGVKGDLVRALGNLLSNAAKHGGEGKWIGVGAAVRDGKMVVTVADRGPGIPAEERESIFQPFVRGERALLDQVRGTGLGLSLVKDLAVRMGGDLTVRPGSEGGAVFEWTVPVKERVDDEFAHTAGGR